MGDQHARRSDAPHTPTSRCPPPLFTAAALLSPPLLTYPLPAETDFAQVVTFATVASSQSSRLLQMTPTNRALLKKFINDAEAWGGTNMGDAFTKAFDVLDSSSVPSSSSGCNKAIVFLTDGVNSGAADPLSVINTRNGGPYDGVDMDTEQSYTRIFTFTFGSGVTDITDMTKIACQNGGIYHDIKDSEASKLKEVMANYFVYLAAGLAPRLETNQVTVRWVDIYEDGQGRGQMTAVCSPIYNYMENPPVLFGIICVGITMDEATLLSGWDSEWDRIQTQQKTCSRYPLRLTWNQLEALRGHSPWSRTCEAVVAMSTISGSVTFPGSPPLGSAKSVFTTQFRDALGGLLNSIGPESITVTSILAGSIVVSYEIRVSTARSVSTNTAVSALTPGSIVVDGVAAEEISKTTVTDDNTDCPSGFRMDYSGGPQGACEKEDTTAVIIILLVFVVLVVLMLLSICWCWRKGGCANPVRLAPASHGAL